jgi:hypothetical protein
VASLGSPAGDPNTAFNQRSKAAGL